MKRFPRFGAVWTILLLACTAGPAVGQAGDRIDVRDEVLVGSEMEEYLRLLQVLGKTPSYPWSIRGFSPAEVERLLPADSMHPWADRYDLRPDSTPGRRVGWVSPEAGVVYNSAFPFGQNDGAMWAGRGATAVLRGGVSARLGPLSLTLAPVAFVAQNADFDLASNAQEGDLAYADGVFPRTTDRPQRFGDGTYARLDPGQSTLRLDVGPLATGVSTANQHWGPAAEHPLILGRNAPGFPHAFVGTSRPLGIGIGRLHGRLVWGRLEQSDFSSMPADSAVRMASSAVVVFTPRGVDGLELGATRFFHLSWPEGGPGLDEMVRPLEGLLKADLTGEDGEAGAANQLASVFARWVFPRSGLEVYGEFAREDHSYDMRDFLLEPDHSSAFMLGFRRAWERSDGSVISVRGEVLDARRSHLDEVRHQGTFYTHSRLRQGHTHAGQFLGTPAAFGGSGSVLAVDGYHRGGRWTVSWLRMVHPDPRRESGPPSRVDALHALGADALFFRGDLDVTAALRAVYEVDRDFQDDAFNLQGALSVRLGL